MNSPDDIIKDIFLAGGDKDDCIFFKDALKEPGAGASLTISGDGEELMDNLNKKMPLPPDVIFPDLNMSRKNEFECLEEVKKYPSIKIFRLSFFLLPLNLRRLRKRIIRVTAYIFQGRVILVN